MRGECTNETYGPELVGKGPQLVITVIFSRKVNTAQERLMSCIAAIVTVLPMLAGSVSMSCEVHNSICFPLRGAQQKEKRGQGRNPFEGRGGDKQLRKPARKQPSLELLQ